MKSVIKRRKKAKHYEMVIKDIIDILKEYIIFLLMFVILLVFHVMRGSWGGHLGLFLDVFFLPVVLVGNWGYEFRVSQCNEFGRNRYKASEVALREDSSNPLYVKGCFRKNYKRNPNSKMAKLKGYYFCQIIAMIQMPVMIIRSIYIIVAFTRLENVGRYYSVVWPDLIIFSSLAISRVLWLAFYIYYNGIINAERKKNQGAFFKEKAMCRKCLRNNNYETFFYKRFSEYSKMFNETETAFQEKFHGTEYLLLGTGGNMEDNIKLDAAEDRENNNLQILVQMYQRRLKKEHIEMMNQFVRKEVCHASKRTLPLGFPYVTYFIYVEEKSHVFEEIFCGEIRQRNSFFALPVGVVLKEEKMYIPGMQKGFGYEEYDRMKENIFEILSQRDPDKDRILLPCGWTHTYRK